MCLRIGIIDVHIYTYELDFTGTRLGQVTRIL